MSIMMDVENFWLVMAIDLNEVDEVLEQIMGPVNAGLDGLPVKLVGMHRPTVESMHAKMAILHPDWEVIGFWRLSELIVDKLTRT